MRRWVFRLASLGLLVGLFLGCLAYWALHQTQAVPDFYEQAVLHPPQNTAQIRQAMEAEVQHLQRSVQRTGSWSATFSDEEINAWLETALSAVFPKLLPHGVSDPRVMVEEDRLLAAARYQDQRIETVVSCELRVTLTDEPNIMAVRIENLRAGALPLPLGRFVKKISHEVSKSDIEVRWDQEEGNDTPVALVTVPSEHESYVRKPVIFESVELRAGELTLAGHTGPEARRSFNPQGAIYQLASLSSPPRFLSDSQERLHASSSRN
jgi:hypothetical protein